ncbi:transposase [Prescottella soli]|uniref:Transposase n=1 Tax=Prescottella soli TaxID=1543852 RepID=A0ABW9FSN5_9NOCA
MLKRYRYRAYPTPGQEKDLARLFGCVRVAWNDALAARETARAAGSPVPSRAELSAALTASKRIPARAWLAEVSSVPLQQALADLHRAYGAFFDSRTGKRRGRAVGAPRLKKRTHRQSVRFTRNAGFKIAETAHGVGLVALPKIGRIRFEASRLLPSDPSSVTVTREADGRFYVSFVVDVPDTPLQELQTVAGVDLGLIDLATIVRSDGTREKIDHPRHLRVAERRLARAQKALSRKRKGSQNRAKARIRVAGLHRKVRETRLDHHHKLARRLVHENQVVAVEDLAVSGLARTRLAKSVHDAGWSILVRLLEEKASQCGRQVVKVNRWFPSTRTCSQCGAVGEAKPLHVRGWECECGACLDRDYNAAVNIIDAAGLAESLNACGGDVRLRLAAADPDETGTRRTDPTPAGEAA